MKQLLMIAVFAACALVVGVWLTVLISMSKTIDAAEDDTFEISAGMTVTEVARKLKQQGVVQTPELIFRLYARLTASEGFPKAGEYRLEPGMSSADALKLFRSGRVIQRVITFPEGWTFEEWRSLLASVPRLRQTIATLTDEEIMAQLGNPEVAAEGQFFPDTYQYAAGDTDLSILRRAHEAMLAALDREWRARTPGLPLETVYDALILASIVEKETGFPPDRDPIAGVFTNRLNLGMRLQSDPTVIYGIEDFDGDLRRSDLREATPYNTYVIRGLPPTPICNPGIEAIRAVMNPAPVPYRYFVARGDGSSEFSVTLDEHNAAVRRYQLRAREDLQGAKVE